MRRAPAVWGGLVAVIALPVGLAAASPLLAWRDAVYVAGGFAGILALALMLTQPALAAGLLPGLSPGRARRLHRWGGGALVVLVLAHVAGLWLTSPPDVVDVLLFRSPTPFSVWGALAMWAVFAAGALALVRHRLRPRLWRGLHRGLAAAIVGMTVAHALLIEGAMETVSKALLCLAVIAATGIALRRRIPWRGPSGGA